MMKKIVRTAVLFFTVMTAAVMGFVVFLNASLPDELYKRQGSPFCWMGCPSVQLEYGEVSSVSTSLSQGQNAQFTVLGVIPVKSASVMETEERYLVPCGTPFGLKMLADGVVTVGFSPIETTSGTVCPVKDAGMREGDVIKKVNGEKVTSYRQLKKLVAASLGERMEFTAKRQGKEITFFVTPVQDLADSQYKCGIWVRDSSAGIGTMTFYDTASGLFGGLGHGVTDADTGDLMPFLSGETVPVSILSIVKGAAGSPGELQGSFSSAVPSGKLIANTESGVFGSASSSFSQHEAVPAALNGEIETGRATILCTLSGNTPEEYEIEIEKINTDDSSTRNMVIRVTDQRLLEKTGGIIQGMSGSPILQNGRLIGAVTHVFVNDPQRGYGIFIGNMLSALEEVAGDKAA